MEILVICGIVVSWGLVVVITGLNCCNCVCYTV